MNLPQTPSLSYLSIMKVLISETQYVTLMEDIKKEQYKELVLNLLETLFGKLSIEYAKDDDDMFHAVYDQNGADIADIYLGKYGNTGCKKDLTLSRDVTEILEGYVPYFRHKIFSKVFIDYIHDKLGIKCDCIHYEYKFENKVEIDDDGTEYDWTKSKTRKYNVKKKKKIKESIDSKKKLFIDLLGEDLINSIRKITSAKELPKEFLKSLGSWSIQQYIDAYGPLYYFVFDGEPFIYKDRVNPKGEEYEMFINSKGESFFNGQITNRLGLDYTGLKFSEVIDMFLNEEEDTPPLNESVDKNKKFLINVMGQDLTDSIQKITSTKQLSKEFLKHFGASKIVQQHFIDSYGPLYYFVLDGEPFIYKQRVADTGEKWEIYYDDKGHSFYKNEIPEKLGIDVIGLNFSDVINILFNEGEPLNESVDKNKKFLIDVMGMDFTDKIQQVTSSYDVPMSFDEGVGPNLINRWLNNWGPMYLVNIKGKKYLYQDRGEFEMFIDEEGYDYVDGEVLEEIGIGVLGLKFSDIIDMFFNEEDNI